MFVLSGCLFCIWWLLAFVWFVWFALLFWFDCFWYRCVTTFCVYPVNLSLGVCVVFGFVCVVLLSFGVDCYVFVWYVLAGVCVFVSSALVFMC